jgi:hypothetical protein
MVLSQGQWEIFVLRMEDPGTDAETSRNIQGDPRRFMRDTRDLRDIQRDPGKCKEIRHGKLGEATGKFGRATGRSGKIFHCSILCFFAQHKVVLRAGSPESPNRGRMKYKYVLNTQKSPSNTVWCKRYLNQ